MNPKSWVTTILEAAFCLYIASWLFQSAIRAVVAVRVPALIIAGIIIAGIAAFRILKHKWRNDDDF